MKKYVKVQMVAKNNATGSYVAGCPAKEHGNGWRQNDCRECERTM